MPVTATVTLTVALTLSLTRTEEHFIKQHSNQSLMLALTMRRLGPVGPLPQHRRALESPAQKMRRKAPGQGTRCTRRDCMLAQAPAALLLVIILTSFLAHVQGNCDYAGRGLVVTASEFSYRPATERVLPACLFLFSCPCSIWMPEW